LRCLGSKGKFVEIGKYDIVNNTAIGMFNFWKGTTVIGIMPFEKLSTEDIMVLQQHMIEGILNGAVKPISRHVFEVEDAEKAFRFMASSRHKGKVLIKIREEERNTPKLPIKLKGLPT
jgi:fatty acid synthase, animal type